MGKLEKIVSSTKKHWKEIVTAIALPFMFESNVKAGYLYTRCDSSINKPSVSISHVSGATENYDTAYDAVYLQGPSPRICFYSKT